MHAKDRAELRLPFSGSYQAIHEIAFVAAAQSAGVGMDEVDWPVVRLGYAQAYMREVSRLTGLEMTFSRLNAPGFCNFGTDEILVRVDADRIAALHAGIMADPDQAASFRDRVREALSPRAGFAPYLSEDLDEWGPVETWEPAQVSLLLEHAFARAGTGEDEITDSIVDRTVELIFGAPRAMAYQTPEPLEDPSP